LGAYQCFRQSLYLLSEKNILKLFLFILQIRGEVLNHYQ